MRREAVDALARLPLPLHAMNLTTQVRGKHYTFQDLKEVLAKAGDRKSGDELAGVAAANDSERVAARRVLAAVRMCELRERPAAPYETDEVTRLIQDDIDPVVFARVRDWTVAELREHVLSPGTSGEDLVALGKGLTSECIAAVAKLMTNLDLITAAAKIRVVTHANTTLGLRGRHSVRLQPNHTLDDPDGILASAMEGLSWGAGDALIGPTRERWYDWSR